ncbi:MAG: AMP-binding protein, partial [Actinobacteria bacterium]|nr:AMP-binding protein [Actinomycetota bacterium]
MSAETRRFAPSAAFAANAVAKESLYAEAKADRLGFWAKQANQLSWHKPFTKTLDWSNAPFARWFDDGELNVSYNCLDRHVEAGNGDRVAIYFEGEPGDTKTYTYAELTKEVKRAANVLSGLGIKAGDRVAIYLPMIPEAVIAMQAVARIGAVHSVVFGGFSADSLRTRINDAQAKLVITADGGYRKGKATALKPAVDEALSDNQCASVENVLVVKRTNQEISWTAGRDLDWAEELA